MAVYDPETGKMIEPPTHTSDAAKAVLVWFVVIVVVLVVLHWLGGGDIGPGIGG